MSRTQIGLRLPVDEAEELRAAAKDRRMSLGELVMTLLRESRAESGRGLWLELNPPSQVALRAVAAAADAPPEQVLQGFAAKWLADDLSRLRAALSAGDRRNVPLNPAASGPLDEDDMDEPDSVLFTVSED